MLHNRMICSGGPKMRSLKIMATAVVLTLATAFSAHGMSISFSWGPTKSCFDRRSPPISIKAVPSGTAKLRLKLTDLNAPSYPHGGSTRTYKGQSKLPYGYFSYKGPCPPRPQSHKYRITIYALDSKGKVIKRASATRSFKQ